MVELPQNPLKHRHHWKQWSGGLKAFYGDDLSCRSTHKQGLDVNIRFPCSNPRRLHCSDYTALIIRQYRRLLSICIVSSGRRLNALSPELGLFLSKQAREAARRREVASRMESSWRWSPNWMASLQGLVRRGEEDAIQCFNLYSHEFSLYFSVSYLHKIRLSMLWEE